MPERKCKVEAEACWMLEMSPMQERGVVREDAKYESSRTPENADEMQNVECRTLDNAAMQMLCC